MRAWRLNLVVLVCISACSGDWRSPAVLLRPILLALTAVAALSVAYPARANLITNGGFGLNCGFNISESGDDINDLNDITHALGRFCRLCRKGACKTSAQRVGL